MKFYFTALLALVFSATSLRAQTTVFTYQGVLNSSTSAVTGTYDFQFRIFDVNSNVVAGPLTNAPVNITNGLFTVMLNFGAGVFDGSARSLEIAVRSYGNSNPYTVLSPRQTLTSVPYAIQALNASNAVSLTAPLQATNLSGTIPNSLLSTNVAMLNTTNANFSGNVTAGLFTGNGQGLTNVPGMFFWTVVSGTSTQTQPNTGYNCTNDVTPVTVTLPPSASLNVGDIFRVAGLGAAGWIVAQNTGQTIFAGNLVSSIGQSWGTNGPPASWTSVAASASGTKIAATINGNQIYVSTNSGVTWTGHASGLNWSDVAVSADGTKMAATVGNNTGTSGYIYTSTDSGTTWNQQSGSNSRQWISIASSADGTKLVAAVYGGYLYVSTNSGTNWASVGTSLPGSLNWSSVASSADGTKLVAVSGATGGSIYTSTNSGSTWLQRTNTSLHWTTVASSSDGSRLIAAEGGSGSIYTSVNSGTTWVAATPSGQWTSVASSSDGSRLAAAATSSGYIYTSTDSGATWIWADTAPSASWTGIASSSDGSLLVAVTSGSYIYVSSQASTTTGTAGYLTGAQHTAIELEYVGNGNFIPLSHEGTIRAY